MSNTPEIPGTQRQGLFVLCLKRNVEVVVNRLEQVLQVTTQQQNAGVVVSYGIMEKQYDGYVVMEYAGTFPGGFIKLLRDDMMVEEFIIYTYPETAIN